MQSPFDINWNALFDQDPQEVAAIAQCPYQARPWQPKASATSRVLLGFFGERRGGQAALSASEPPASSIPPPIPGPVGPGPGHAQLHDDEPGTASQAASTQAPPTASAEIAPPLASQAISFIPTLSSIGDWALPIATSFSTGLATGLSADETFHDVGDAGEDSSRQT